MSKNILCLYFYMFLFVLLFSNNSGFAQSENKITLKPVLSVEIGEADYIRNKKAKEPKLADFRGLVMKKSVIRNPYAFLNYIFFDEGKSEIPERYILLQANGIESFNDTTILGGTMDKYYHILNIYAFRLIHNPNLKIKIIGCNDNVSKAEKGNIELSKARAMNVFNYFKDVWKIDEKRMEISWRNLPKHPTNPKKLHLSMQENRRVEIICDDWKITSPVYDVGSVTEPQPPNMNFVMINSIDSELILNRKIEITHGTKIWNTLTEIGISKSKSNWNWKSIKNHYPMDEVPFIAQLVIKTKSGEEIKSEPMIIPLLQIQTGPLRIHVIDSIREIYNLILFPFDRFEINNNNIRILSDIICPKIFPNSAVIIIGHTDIVGEYDHNMRLSQKIANTISDYIKNKSNKKYASMFIKGVGEEDPLFTNELPEGRFYNRIVQVFIKTDLNEFLRK